MTKAARKAKPATQTVSFAIHGEDMTRLARERLLDDNPGSAWRIASCLIGDADSKGEEAGAALAILKGDKKLVGKNTMQLVDEDPHVAKVHKERIEWLFAGRIRINEQWFRPVARVTSFGPRDMRDERVRRVEHGQEGPGGWVGRQWHYCFDGEIAPLAHTRHDNADVIFQPCGEPPQWLAPAADVDAAIKQWADAGRQLEERGHVLWYKDNGDDLDGRSGGLGYQDWLDEQQRADDLNEALATSDEPIDPGEAAFDAYVDAQLRADGFVRAHVMTDADEAAERLAIKLEEDRRQRRLRDLRTKILEQANGDLIELTWDEEKLDERDLTWDPDRKPRPAGSAQLPRAPFLHWAFDRLHQFDAVKPPWTPVSPVGMKMGGDNPYHSDWVIGAGFDPRDDKMVYSGPMYAAALHLAWLQQERFSAERGIHVLVAGPGVATGKVVHGRPDKACEPGSIVVLPNLHPRYLLATKNAAAVITEEGGETAHLAQVGRENGLLIVRVPDARELYPAGLELVINASRRTIREL